MSNSEDYIMNVLVISDSHIVKTSDGRYWCETAVHGYDFWVRYTKVFEEVHVVSRVQKKDKINEEKYIRADGKGVKIIDLPFVRGFGGYVKNFIPFSKEIKKSLNNEDVAIFRVPSLPAFILLHYYKKLKKPYAFEVIVDPMDCYKENKIAQILFTTILKKECMKANGVSYVTRYFLEKKYPCLAFRNPKKKGYFSSYYSSINLDKSFFGVPKKFDRIDKLNIIHVASAINSDVKGHTTLINIVEKLKADGYNVHLACVGAGDRVPYYKQMVKDKNLTKEVEFLGLFSSKDTLRELLLSSDIFVFPSKAEGLPRAVIEAMATGLPCLSTSVNGIPELLDNKYLFDPMDVNGFVEKIEQLIKTPEELTKMSSTNLKKAAEYENDILEKRRNIFYRKLRQLAE